MNSLYLIATIAGEDVAIPAHQVESVVKVRDVVAVPAVKPFVSGLFALRSRVLTLIDCQYFVTGTAADPGEDQTAIVAEVSGHFYGFLVDAVKDVCEAEAPPESLPVRLADGWKKISTAMVVVHGKSVLVVDPADMIEPARSKAA